MKKAGFKTGIIRIFSLLLCAAFVLSAFCGCGGKQYIDKSQIKTYPEAVEKSLEFAKTQGLKEYSAEITFDGGDYLKFYGKMDPSGKYGKFSADLKYAGSSGKSGRLFDNI